MEGRRGQRGRDGGRDRERGEGERKCRGESEERRGEERRLGPAENKIWKRLAGECERVPPARTLTGFLVAAAEGECAGLRIHSPVVNPR